jgi:hypothetical protein
MSAGRVIIPQGKIAVVTTPPDADITIYHVKSDRDKQKLKAGESDFIIPDKDSQDYKVYVSANPSGFNQNWKVCTITVKMYKEDDFPMAN